MRTIEIEENVPTRKAAVEMIERALIDIQAQSVFVYVHEKPEKGIDIKYKYSE